MAFRTTGQTLAIIGCGKMATAVLRAVLEREESSSNQLKKVLVCVRSSESAERLKATFSEFLHKVEIVINDNVRAIAEADVIMLGHKPFQLHTVLHADGIPEAMRGKLIISILAGITPAQINEALFGGPSHAHIIRAVPNMAAQVGESTTCIAEPEPGTPQDMVNFTTWYFGLAGSVTFLPDSLYGLAVVMVGACIALTTVAVDGMLDAAVIEGMQRPKALEIISQCLMGTSKLLSQGIHPAVLRESISSPRGCTIQAIAELERRNARSAFTDSIVKACDHLKDMGSKQD